MDLERNIGREALVSAEKPLKRLNRLREIGTVGPRIASFYWGYEAVQAYSQDDARTAITAGATMAAMEGIRIMLAKCIDEQRDAVLEDAISAKVDELVEQHDVSVPANPGAIGR